MLPDQTGQDLPAVAGPIAQIASRRDSLRAEQVGAVGAAAVLLWYGQTFQVSSQLPAHPWLVWAALLISATAFVALGYAVMVQSLSRARRRVGVVVIVVCLLVTSAATIAVQIVFVTPFYGTDGLALSHLAAERLLAGLDPYTFTTQVSDLERFGVPEYAITTTTFGGLIAPSVSYPAASFLIYVPALLLGIHDLRWVTLAGEILCLVVLALAVPPSWRIVALLVVLGNVDLGAYGTSGGRTDWLWVAPCMLMIVDVHSGHWIRGGLWFGLAAAMKQQPWLLAPFLLVWLYHLGDAPRGSRIRHVVRFAGSAGGTFVIINLPFMALDPIAWIRGVGAPILEPLIPHGQGLSLISQYGLIDLPKAFYSIMAIGSLVTLAVVYGLAYHRAPNAVWVLPVVVLWFGYRSYQDYFLYWVPLLTLGLLSERRRCTSA